MSCHRGRKFPLSLLPLRGKLVALKQINASSIQGFGVSTGKIPNSFLLKTESTRQHEDLECFLQDKGVTFSPQNNKLRGICVLPQRQKFSTFPFCLRGKLVAVEQINAYSSQMLDFQAGFGMLHKENNSYDITFHSGEKGELLVLASYKSAHITYPPCVSYHLCFKSQCSQCSSARLPHLMQTELRACSVDEDVARQVYGNQPAIRQSWNFQRRE